MITKHMTKILTVLLVACMALALLTACENGNNNELPYTNSPELPTSENEETPYTPPVDPNCDHEEVIDESIPATCEESGKTEGSHCAKCGEIIKAQEEVKELGHLPIVINKKEPTCDDKGYTGDTVCDRCGEELEKGTTIPTLELPELPEFHVLFNDGSLSQYGPCENATNYEVYMDGELVYSGTALEFDFGPLVEVSGYHDLTWKATADGYKPREVALREFIKKTLSAPVISIEDGILTIEPVPYATGYLVLIDGVEYTTNKTTLDLFAVTDINIENPHTVCVQAYRDDQTWKNSDNTFENYNYAPITCEHTDLIAYDGTPYGYEEYHFLQCKGCGYWLPDEKHNYVDGTCDVCGHVFICPHNSTNFVDNGDGVTHNKVCNGCNEVIATGWSHYGYDDNGICAGCGANVEIAACEHLNIDYYDADNGKHEMWCADCEMYLGMENHVDADAMYPICAYCGADLTGCDHPGFRYLDIGDGTHALFCVDCDNWRDGSTEEHYDENEDGYCDACDGEVCEHSNTFYSYLEFDSHCLECEDCWKVLRIEDHYDNDGDTECDACHTTIAP